MNKETQKWKQNYKAREDKKKLNKYHIYDSIKPREDSTRLRIPTKFFPFLLFSSSSSFSSMSHKEMKKVAGTKLDRKTTIKLLILLKSNGKRSFRIEEEDEELIMGFLSRLSRSTRLRTHGLRWFPRAFMSFFIACLVALPFLWTTQMLTSDTWPIFTFSLFCLLF